MSQATGQPNRLRYTYKYTSFDQCIDLHECWVFGLLRWPVTCVLQRHVHNVLVDINMILTRPWSDAKQQMQGSEHIHLDRS